jgi:flagellar FliL protein
VTMTQTPPVGLDPTLDAAPGAARGTPEAAGGKGKKKRGKKERSGSGRSNLLPAVVLAAGIAAGGYFMGGGGASSAQPPATSAPPAVEPGEMAVLEPLTVNLDGSRYLRVGVSILTEQGFELVHGNAEKGEPSRFTPADENRLRDQVIAMFSGRELDEVVGADQLAVSKAELLERANEVLDGAALEVYFTEFVTQ